MARGIGGYYWPDGIRADDSVQAWRELFALCFGYEECADGSVEANMDKIAIYADREGDAAHVARQLPSGQWTSKLGKLEDITHDTLEALICDDYATVVILMRRQRT
ncbi:MAG: hypothetical protein HYU41_18340 [Candidatus Rokubacteria bacterium]|nr:hypothetical protein [Candidatus Rokubacteria bacterium]